MPRLTSDFFVAAYVRRRNDAGKFTAVVRRGSTEAGAIFVKVARLDRTADLFGPAPQSLFSTDELAGGRAFECLMTAVPEFEADERLQREVRFDPDCWIVETECRQASHDLDLATDD